MGRIERVAKPVEAGLGEAGCAHARLQQRGGRRADHRACRGTRGGSAQLDDKLAQQQDGRQQLDRIREQFEAQEAESKRKLERLNGRIAELGEGKRAGGMFAAAFGGGGGARQQQPKPGGGGDGAAAAGERWRGARGEQEALNRREAELNKRAASLAKAEAEAASKMEAATAQRRRRCARRR